MNQHPEAIQWRNVKKIVKALADWGFGSPNDPDYGHCHVAMTTGLTAKDGPDFSTIGLEKFPQEAMEARLRALQPLFNEIQQCSHRTSVYGDFNINVDARLWAQIKDHL